MPRPKTRSKDNASSAPDVVKTEIEDQPEEALKLLILPDLPPDASKPARFCTLPHPRTSKPCRYYCYPTAGPGNGIYEFRRTAAPRSAYRGWLIGRASRVEQDACDSNPDVQHPEPDTDGEDHAMESANEPANAKIRPVASGYVIQSPEMFIATPIDPLFLIIPSLLVTIAKNDPSSRGLFLSFDDIFEQRSEGSPHFSSIISHVPLQHTIIERMKIVCDMVTAGDEAMYRLNIDKLLTELLTKAQKMAALGLPPSMEEKFVRKALERPIMAIKREDSTASAGAESCVEDTRTADIASAEGDDSQASASTSGSTSSEASAATSVTIPDDKPPSQTPKDIEQLLRLKVALSYMFAAYMPQTLVTTLNAKLAAEDSPIDFKPLEKELSLISEMRREALASRSFADFSRKRGMEDEDAAASRAEKKAKKEEEEKKRKASETRGVRDLKKVDVSGMKKMSDFFTKKPTAIKKT